MHVDRQLPVGPFCYDRHNAQIGSFTNADSTTRAAYSDRFICVPRCVLWHNGATLVYDVYTSRFGIWRRHFDWYQLRLPTSTKR